MAKAIPDGFHAITAALTVRHGAQAIDFYKRALGAEELMRIPGPDGKSLMHAELKIGDSIFMLSDEQPGVGCRAPASVGGPTSYLYVYVPRSEERRVGKECRARWEADKEKKKDNKQEQGWHAWTSRRRSDK